MDETQQNSGQQTFSVNWAEPQQLLWLWLLPLLAVVAVSSWRRRQRRLSRLLGAAAPTLSRRRSYAKAAMIMLAVACLVMALARPRLGFDWADVKKRGVDIVIAVDVSRSMLAADVDPDRLTRAKRELIDLLTIIKGDRVGLVAFAGDAFVQCPLTEDYAAVRLFLDVLDPNLIPNQGTNLGRAIEVSLKALEEGSPDGKGSPSIIMITDGEDLDGKAEQAAALAKEKGVRLFTIGIGNPDGAPIPEIDGGFKKDSSGNLIVTKPNEQALQKLALATDGAYVRSVGGAMDLTKIYTDGIRRGATLTDYHSQRERLWHERFQWFLVAAALLLALEALWPERLKSLNKKPAKALATLILLFLGGAFGTLRSETARAASVQDAEKSYEQGDYAAAAKGFAAAEAADPAELRRTYNRALSQYRAGQFKEAAQGFAKAAGSKDSEVANRSLFNLGNTLSNLGQYEEASKAYESLLARRPDDQAARENLAAVQKLKEQQPPPQEKQEEQDKDKDKQKEEEKKQDEQKQQENQNQDQQQKDSGQKDSEQKPQEQQQQENQNQQEKQDNQAKQDQQKNDNKDGEKSDKQEAEKSAQKEGEKDEKTAAAGEPTPQPSPDSKAEQAEQKAVATANKPEEKASKEQLEKSEALLRSLDDNPGKYLYRQEDESQQRGSEDPSKDW